MERTKLKDRVLPSYTKGEEIFNMVTHIIGGAMGVVALVLCIIFSALHHDGYALAGSIVYGLSMIILFTMSSIYHGISPKHQIAKKVFQIMDHDTIFVLIAGTYTPILLVTIREADPFWAWMLLAIVWGISILGIVLNSIDIERFKVFSMICYLGLGWCIVFKFNLLLSYMALNGIILLVAGGIAYTVGCIFYKLGDTKKYMHSIWHIWILIGALCHFLTILLYVI